MRCDVQWPPCRRWRARRWSVRPRPHRFHRRDSRSVGEDVAQNSVNRPAPRDRSNSDTRVLPIVAAQSSGEAPQDVLASSEAASTRSILIAFIFMCVHQRATFATVSQVRVVSSLPNVFSMSVMNTGPLGFGTTR